ncbi:MAG: HAMP domain-containing histidine kinase [Firmicutes bacterium]|nr:HAMP domain-containing histidine kinase [Bacillota bacterium]
MEKEYIGDKTSRISDMTNEFMSHELKNALNMMMASCTMAQKHIDDRDRVLYYLSRIDMTVSRMSGLIDSIFTSGKNKEDVEMLYTSFDIKELENDLEDLLTPLALEKNIKFTVSTEGFVSREVLGDYGRILQIMVNIATNSIKYTHLGGTVTITFEEEKTADPEVVTGKFTCIDNGVGIPETFMEHIFEPYARADDKRTKSTPGTGLGMSIVKDNVDAMGGSIHIDSKVDKGTKVTIRLKLKKNVRKA